METAIFRAQIDHALNQITMPGLLGMAVVLLTGGVLYGHYPNTLLISWCVASCLIFALRIASYAWLNRHLRGPERYPVFRVMLVAATLLSSVVWGSAALLFLDHPDSQEFVFVSLVIAGMVSGSMPSYAAYLPSYLCFVIPTCSVLIYQYHAIGMKAASLLAGLHMIGLIGISIGLRRVITNSITIDLKNTELLQEVTAARDEAEHANRAKSLFMAAASHDLRQPLHAMGLLLSTLSDRLANAETGTRTLVGQVVQSHDALTQLFNAILQMSMLESGSQEVHPADMRLGQTLAQLVDEFRPAATARGLVLIEDWQDCTIRSDATLLNRILRNLLSNAIKFTGHGHVRISTVLEGDALLLSIADTGIGIPVEEQENIFQEYYQLGNSARDRAEGIGLGLSVVKRACLRLGHTLSLISAPGLGTCFTLRIALGDQALLPEVEVGPLVVPVDGKRLVLIDDDRAVLAATEGLLTAWGCQVIAAESVAAALDALSRQGARPELIISDYRLKDGLTGLEAIAEINKRYGLVIPAILLSGDTDPELVSQAREHGVFLLHKPLKPAHLRNAMRQLEGFPKPPA